MHLHTQTTCQLFFTNYLSIVWMTLPKYFSPINQRKKNEIKFSKGTNNKYYIIFDLLFSWRNEFSQLTWTCFWKCMKVMMEQMLIIAIAYHLKRAARKKAVDFQLSQDRVVYFVFVRFPGRILILKAWFMTGIFFQQLFPKFLSIVSEQTHSVVGVGTITCMHTHTYPTGLTTISKL